MKFIIIGKNIDVTPGLREAVESKLGKLGRYFTPNTEIHVTLSVQKGHQKIEVTIPVKGGLVRSEQESSDMYVSIDLVEEVIERQLRKYKNKLIQKEQNLSLNPTKISGVCGRLMCCLTNEEETYEVLNSQLPSVGDTVTTSDGLTGVVQSLSVLRGLVKVVVNLEDDEKEIREYKATDLKFRPRRKKKNPKKDGDSKENGK